MGGGAYEHLEFEEIISIENLLLAWQEFIRGKRKKKDVQEFQLNLMQNIFALHDDLVNLSYRHGGYQAFNISDPKPRSIHKASVRDRLLHHAIYRVLYPYFDPRFISDSFSCRNKKGTHKALNRFRNFANKVSKNNTRTCWILKCDIRKFFANIDHAILKLVLQKYVQDDSILWLLGQVIDSFHSSIDKGLPLGNLTSQLLVNVYMNEFDQFVKYHLRLGHYIRYADDFVIFLDNKNELLKLIARIKDFLKNRLSLDLHPDKIFIKTIASGLDFLGWVHFHDHRILRTTTRRRMLKRMKNNPRLETIASYLGLISHGNTYKLRTKLLFNHF